MDMNIKVMVITIKDKADIEDMVDKENLDSRL